MNQAIFSLLALAVPTSGQSMWGHGDSEPCGMDHSTHEEIHETSSQWELSGKPDGFHDSTVDTWDSSSRFGSESGKPKDWGFDSFKDDWDSSSRFGSESGKPKGFHDSTVDTWDSSSRFGSESGKPKGFHDSTVDTWDSSSRFGSESGKPKDWGFDSFKDDWDSSSRFGRDFGKPKWGFHDSIKDDWDSRSRFGGESGKPWGSEWNFGETSHKGRATSDEWGHGDIWGRRDTLKDDKTTFDKWGSEDKWGRKETGNSKTHDWVDNFFEETKENGVHSKKKRESDGDSFSKNKHVINPDGSWTKSFHTGSSENTRTTTSKTWGRRRIADRLAQALGVEDVDADRATGL